MHVLTDDDVKSLPSAVRRMLNGQCEGEWDRVTIDEGGAYTVWNSPTQALAKCGGQPAPESAPRAARASVAQPAPPLPAPRPVAKRTIEPSRRNKSAEAAKLQEMVGHVETIKPGVTIVSAPAKPAEPDPHLWVGDGEHFDWSAIDLEMSVVRLREQLREGLPENIPFRFHADVLALQGWNLDAVEAAIRFPQRVEIRPETKVKQYPVLAFHRGDVIAILGMRNPTSPMCIAAYLVSRYDADLVHGPAGSTGGGGAKRQHTGLPTSVRAMIRQLRAIGAEIDDDPHQTTAEVKYHGQSLGKVSTGTASKQQVQTDYQRTVRKMHAIDRHDQKVGASV